MARSAVAGVRNGVLGREVNLLATCVRRSHEIRGVVGPNERYVVERDTGPAEAPVG